ncbi:MAG TPA: hypothetical protein DDX07_07145 [Porphyromonadaceae bacterium]|jgi:hypothetical protein|nr:hypothetical protein [Porphyromonadaceae bacterium]
MFKTNIKTLFKEIRSIPLESADPDLLAHISFGFRNLLILAYTMPWVTETLGDEAAPHALTARMMEASDRLAKELDKDMTPEDRARCIVYLLHTLSFHYNPDHMEIAENAATEVINNVDLAQKATPATPATEPHQYLSLADSPYLCKILCYDYYFRTEKDSRKKAENLLTKWDKELQKNGFWLDVTEDMALQRLEAYSLFSDVADQHKYEKTIRKAIQYYSELPQITDEVRFLFLLAHMGTFRNYPEQVEQIMDNVLEGKLSATATGSISDKVRNAKPNMLKALQFHILALYLLNTEQE